MDKIIGLLSKAHPNQEGQPDDGTPWYFKYGSRALGIVGSFFCFLFGLLNCLSIITANIRCLVAGILMICIGFVVMAVEAPFCCMFIDHVQTLSAKIDQRPLWNRAIVYCVLAIIPVCLCFDISTFFACGLVFGSGVVYGMMGLGKKASLEDMRKAAAAQTTTSSKSGSNLASNAAPIGISQPPFVNTV